MKNYHYLINARISIVFILSLAFMQPNAQVITTPTPIELSNPVNVGYTVSGELKKVAYFEIEIEANYSNISLSVGDFILIDNLDIPSTGTHTLNALVKFPSSGEVILKLEATSADLTVNRLEFEDITSVSIPSYIEVTEQIGLTDEASLKYGGPTIADINMDGHYDIIANNHNMASSKLFWNDGDNTFTRHSKDLALWKRMDLHGTTAGDFDKDGDLDLIMSLGGGNGTSPQPPVFYLNNNGSFVRSDADLGITSGARGRGARWVDMDLDGDLDIALFNAGGINGNNGAQHIFYVNKGDGSFATINIAGLENALPNNALMTDLNNDNIDDFVLFSPLVIWKGNGNFTFTDVTSDWLPSHVRNMWGPITATDIDIDNDGDFDLYLACGQGYFTIANNNSVDFVPGDMNLDMKLSGSEGITTFEIEAEGSVALYDFMTSYRSTYDGDFPLFLGSNKNSSLVANSNDTTYIEQSDAVGWPDVRDENGLYMGYIGDGKWRVESVRLDDIFWEIHLSFAGVSAYNADWSPNNRNVNDVLLRNDGGSFVDVSNEWNIPKGGNHWGVTTGDFNNDGFQDLFVHRYGFMKKRTSDYMLLNTGSEKFEVTTCHDANDAGSKTHGDMGMAFDYDLDGDVDILNGDDEYGVWHMYQNQKADSFNFVIVKVNNSPLENVDPYSALVTVETATKTLVRRVGSAGENFSQSRLNMIHFGLGDEDTVELITIRWRNGEIAEFADKQANQIYDTDKVDPEKVNVVPEEEDVRVGTEIVLDVLMEPVFANRSVTWKSLDTAIASVNAETGVVTGKIVGQSTKVVATSTANGLTDTATVNVVEWFAIYVDSVLIEEEDMSLIEGAIVTLNVNIFPKYADNKGLEWKSSDAGIASVDENGMVTTLSEGFVTITATSKENSSLSDEVEIEVIKLIAPSITFDDKNKYLNGEFVTDSIMEVTVDYHAGTGNKVSATFEGGLKFWMRHMSEDWMQVINDYTYLDASVVGTVSGRVTGKISLDSAIPTAELTNGEFYYLMVTFAGTDGETRQTNAYPLNVIKERATVHHVCEYHNNIEAYPNPAVGLIHIKGLVDDNNIVRIYDMSGIEVFSKEIVENQPISISHLKHGVYMLVVQNNKRTASTTILIQ